MLDDRQRDALRRWYRQEHVLAKARRLADTEYWEELEEHLQMSCLFALSRHSELPDWMRTEDGAPLLPTNLNPAQDLEGWRDAVELAWEVASDELGLSRDDVHRRIAAAQEDDWERFMKSVAERERERGEGA